MNEITNYKHDQTYLLLGLLILSFTITPYIKKKVALEFTDEEFFVLNGIFACIFVMIFILYFVIGNKCDMTKLKNKVSKNHMMLCSIVAMASILSGIILIMLLKKNDVSFVIPQVQPIVIILTMLIAYFIANEEINKYKIGGVALIVLGLFFMNYGKTKASNS